MIEIFIKHRVDTYHLIVLRGVTSMLEDVPAWRELRSSCLDSRVLFLFGKKSGGNQCYMPLDMFRLRSHLNGDTSTFAFIYSFSAFTCNLWRAVSRGLWDEWPLSPVSEDWSASGFWVECTREVLLVKLGGSTWDVRGFLNYRTPGNSVQPTVNSAGRVPCCINRRRGASFLVLHFILVEKWHSFLWNRLPLVISRQRRAGLKVKIPPALVSLGDLLKFAFHFTVQLLVVYGSEKVTADLCASEKWKRSPCNMTLQIAWYVHVCHDA